VAIFEKKEKEYLKYQLTSENKAIVAYVMLRSMEGKERLINAYKTGSCKRCCLTYFCCKGKQFKSKYFLKKHWLNVKSAKAPDIINWENLSATKTERFFRISLTTLISLILIAATFILLLISQYYQEQLQKYSP
jgi:hypothetical protein